MYRILFFSLLFAATASQASPGIDALNHFYSNVRSLDTDFQQVLLDDTGEIVQTGRGHFTLSRPSRFRWEYTQPYRQVMISDGQQFWFYDKDLAQVTERPARETLQGSPAELLAGSGNINDQFQVSDLGARGDLHWVKLVPRQQRSDFNEILMAFTDSQRPRLMELRDNLGQTTQITFSALQVNPAVNARLFQFTPPQGVEVVRDAMPVESGPQTYPDSAVQSP